MKVICNSVEQIGGGGKNKLVYHKYTIFYKTNSLQIGGSKASRLSVGW